MAQHDKKMGKFDRDNQRRVDAWKRKQEAKKAKQAQQQGGKS